MRRSSRLTLVRTGFLAGALLLLQALPGLILAPAAHAQSVTLPSDGDSSPSLRLGMPAPMAAPSAPVIEGADPAPPEAPSPRVSARVTPPTPPSEFQRFVESSTGRQLPVFGASFFASQRVPDITTPVSGQYTVGPSDEVLVRAWGGVDINFRARVDRDGLITLPRIGTIAVGGVRAAELEGRVRQRIGQLYRNFGLSVTLGQLRSITVFVVGQAANPGPYTLSSQASLLAAVSASGGPGPTGSMRRVSLRRGGQLVGEFDLYDFLVRGDKSHDLQLSSGDSVVFEAVGPQVALTGAIDRPAIYELLPRGETLADVLRYAGGAPVVAQRGRVQLERVDPATPGAPRTVRAIGMDAAGMAETMAAGDIITLLPISSKFANAVTLKGNVAMPLRHAYTPGMRLRDLIPDKEALIAADYYRRKNLLVAVEPLSREELAAQRRYRNALEASSALPEVAEPRPERASGPRRALREDQFPRDLSRAEQATHRPTELFDEVNWDYAMIERLDPKDLSVHILTFSPRRAILEGDAEANLELRPGDVVTIYSQRDLRVPVAKQTRVVSVEGEVNAAGVYQVLPGETLHQLLQRAGGFTPQAYIYGMEFSRDETRRRQQENLQAAIERLEALSATQTARNAANLTSDVTAAGAAQTSQAATEAQLRRLRALKPNGRIAMELDASVRSVDDIPDVPLEHGDRIVVPPRPGFVTVAGAVANSNAFLWRDDRTADDYLKLAGVEEAADLSQMFILRADGTVMHSGDRRGLFGLGGGVGSQVLHPGDAVIVPSQLDYETWGRALVRNLKDWSQIFYQFGLGAAAIVTLRNN